MGTKKLPVVKKHLPGTINCGGAKTGTPPLPLALPLATRQQHNNMGQHNNGASFCVAPTDTTTNRKGRSSGASPPDRLHGSNKETVCRGESLQRGKWGRDEKGLDFGVGLWADHDSKRCNGKWW